MKVGIIIGTTRPNRMSPREAKWVFNTAQKMDDVDAEIVDLKDYPMPMFDEPISPRYNPDRKIDPAVQPWLKKLEEFDAYVFVTAEYNHSVPGVLKNALDFVTWEFLHKPAMIVSHGAAGGARAQLALKVILSESKAVPIPLPSSVAVVGMSEKIDEDGELTEAGKANEYFQSGLEDTLADLKWYSDALAAARAKS
jgi:NAD(P)H-dependent FMN reductase